MSLTLPPSTDPALAWEVEKASLQAWPPAREIKLDGWLLRFNEGFTDRVNSVQPLTEGEMPLGTKISWCLGAYRDARLPAQFRITSLTEKKEEIERQLAVLGLKSHSPTRVMVLDSLPKPQPAPADWRIETEDPTEWLESFRRMDGTSQHHFPAQEALLRKMPTPHGFGSLAQAGSTVACGQVVVTGNLAGLFDIVTEETLRRQGLGQRVVEALMQWAAGQGAARAYLQVEASNDPATKLYEKLGFRHLYDYHYWRAQ